MCLHAETELGEPHPPQPSFQLLDGTAFTLAASFHNAPGPGGGHSRFERIGVCGPQIWNHILLST